MNIPGKRSGRRALTVPHLDLKLEHLLSRAGRQNKWLTEVLVTPDGRSPSASSISGWKKSGRIPVEYVISVLYAFGLTEDLLELDDLEEFKSRVDGSSQLGSGRYWKALLEQADEAHTGLKLLVEGRPLGERVANLSFSRPQRKVQMMDEVPMDAGIRFSIPRARFELLSAQSTENKLGIVLCCEDRLGWKSLCPNRHHQGFDRDDANWVLPGMTRGPMYLDGTIGLHRAVAVAFARGLPNAIHEAFVSDRSDRTVWATDALAVWLFKTSTPHVVLRRQFLAIAGQR